MSRRRRLGVLCALALLGAALPGPLQAQQTEEELILHMQEIAPLLAEARVEAAAAQEVQDAARRAAQEARVDTFMVGPLRVVAPVGEVDEARAMYTKVWEEDFAPFVTHSPALDRTQFTFGWSAQAVKIVMTSPHQRAEGRIWHRRSEMERRVREAIGKALEQGLRYGDHTESTLFRWRSGPVMPPTRLDWMYRQIATLPSLAVRECLEGIEGACWSSLGLTEAQELDRWYTPYELRRLALLSSRYRGREATPVREACEDGAYASCEELLRQFRSPAHLMPLSPEARSVMLWVALQMGGEGAWDRLLEDRSRTPAEALIYASGSSASELEAEWRALALESRPRVNAGLSTTKWMVLLWSIIFAALAMRSTRWRLG